MDFQRGGSGALASSMNTWNQGHRDIRLESLLSRWCDCRIDPVQSGTTGTGAGFHSMLFIPRVVPVDMASATSAFW